MRPIFAFTIKYDTSGGVKLAEHRQRSVVTLNVNLNTPEEFASGDLKGSSLYFVDAHNSSRRHFVALEPGGASSTEGAFGMQHCL